MWNLAAGAAFAAVLAVLALYASSASWGSIDFKNTAHYPAHALLHGLNPYDAATYLEAYPDATPFPPFAPLTLALYAPFGLLPLPVATAVWFVVTALLTIGLAWFVLRCAGVEPRWYAVLGIATAVLMSRPGEMSITLGQQTTPLVLGSYAALVLAPRRPVLAALGVALATCKPQFGVPLAVFVAAAGYWRVALAGLVASGVASLAVLVVMPTAAGHGPIGTFVSAFTASRVRIKDAATVWWSQIDVPYLLHQLLGEPPSPVVSMLVGLALLLVGVAVVYRLAARRRIGDEELQIGVSFLTMLLCVYHQVYDALLLALPLTLAVAGRAAAHWRAHPWTRLAIIACIAVPAVNYFVTWSMLERFGITGVWWRMATALNAMMLLAAWCLYVATALRRDAAIPTSAAPRLGRDAAIEIR